MGKLSIKQIAKAREMHHSGMTYAEIGRILRVSDVAVRYHVMPGARETIIARATAYRIAHKEATAIRMATYRKNHSEVIAAQRAIYNVAHKKENAASAASRYRRHPDEYRTRNAAWKRRHPGSIGAYNATRRALLVGASVGLTVNQLDEIEEIYRHAKENLKVRCYLCGRLIPRGKRHVDHIIPLSKGGVHRSSNLAVTCDKCNFQKGASLPEDIGLLI